MLRFRQERELDYHYPEGESLNETKKRLVNVIDKIIATENGNVAVFTHKRAILSYLLSYTEHGFNLDDRLILSFNDKVIIDDSEKDIDIIVLDIEKGSIINIEVIDEEGI